MDENQLKQLASMGIKTATKPKLNILPLLSISGITAISFGGLLLLKNKSDTTPFEPTSLPVRSLEDEVRPTQVPKSIQHYLLTSQQYFTEALNRQKNENVVPLVNQAILTASEAVQLFPTDYRSWEQRGRIYQSLIPSQPQYLPIAITDFQQASSLNPTKTDNLFTLANLQEQAGRLPDGLATYYKLLSLISDQQQHNQIINEIQSIRRLLSQNTNIATTPTPPKTTPILDGNLIQASTNNGLVIAAPETSIKTTVTASTQSNSLSGESLLTANQKSITLTNTQLKTISQIYLTILNGGKNQNLQVLSRSKDSFTVGLDSPINEDIRFKWWIVNP